MQILNLRFQLPPAVEQIRVVDCFLLHLDSVPGHFIVLLLKLLQVAVVFQLLPLQVCVVCRHFSDFLVHLNLHRLHLVALMRLQQTTQLPVLYLPSACGVLFDRLLDFQQALL